MKKKLFLLILFLSGCTMVATSNKNYSKIVDTIVASDSKLINTTTLGYKYYIPNGVSLLLDHEFNQKFKVNDTFMYLYTDIVSYYYKNKENYKNEDKNLFYYCDINSDKYNGYLKIKKENNQFYVEIVYNYAKIEMYSSEYYLSSNISYAAIVLSSIKYNDKAIESLMKKNYFSSYEHKYVLEKPDNSESNFLQYSEEYNTYEDDTLPDDKSINNQTNE